MHLSPLHSRSASRTVARPFIRFLMSTRFSWLLLTCFLPLSCGGGGGVSNQAKQPVVKTLSATPSNLDFGQVAVSNTSVLPTVVANTGKSSITVSKVQVTGTGFTVSAPAVPFTLAAGQTASVNVKFSPSTTGAVSGSISVTSDASNSPTVVQLQGNGASNTHSVSLEWDAPVTASGATIDSYNIYRGEALSSSGCSGINFMPEGSTSGAASTTFTDTSVLGGHTYCYQVTAIINSTETLPSNAVEATVPSP